MAKIKPVVKKNPPKIKPATRPKSGKPPINEPTDAEAIQIKIDTYFKDCLKGKDKPTFCGLALALGYSSRIRVWEHSKANEAISEPLKKAMLRIEERYEQGLFTRSPTGSIFALKNRGWTDKQEDGEKDTDNRLTIDFTE